MARVPVQLATKAGDVSRSSETATALATIERLVNLYAEVNPPGAKSPVTLYGSEGLRLAGLSSQPTTVDDEGPSGVHVFGDMIIVAVGAKLWKITATDCTEIGTDELTGQTRQWIPMGDNGTHVWIGGKTKIMYTDGTTVSDVTGGDFVASSIAYQDGYLIATEEATQNFWLSGLDDATTVGALDFSTTDADPDYAIGVVSDHRELFLFNAKTTEVWVNTGAASFPFERAPGGIIERGCFAPQTIRKIANRVLWMGDDRAIYMFNGYQPVRVSTRAVEELLQSASATYSIAYAYSIAGHDFYAIAASSSASPSAGEYHAVYDLATGLWHFRDWNVQFAVPFPISGSVTAPATDVPSVVVFSKVDTGMDANAYYLKEGHNYIGEASANVPIVRYATLPPIFAGSQRAAMSRFILDIKPGIGAAAGDGTDAVVSLSFSDDLGETWSTAQTVSLEPSDKANAYHRQIYWSRLGMFRQRSIKLQINVTASAGTEVIAITGAFADIEARA